MKQTEVIRAARLCEACLCIVLAMTSCSKGNEDAKNVGGENPTGVVTVAEVPRELTKVERLEGECRRLVISAERKRGEKSTSYVINDLCRKIHELPREEALPLLDRWIEMAIKHPVTNANYSIRARMFEQAFDIVFFAINSSLDMRTDHFDHWDKVFRFTTIP